MKISYFPASVGTCNLILHIHVVVNNIDSCENRVSADQYYITVLQAQVLSRRGCIFLKLPTDKLLVFNLLQVQLQVVFFTVVTNFIV